MTWIRPFDGRWGYLQYWRSWRRSLCLSCPECPSASFNPVGLRADGRAADRLNEGGFGVPRGNFIPPAEELHPSPESLSGIPSKTPLPAQN